MNYRQNENISWNLIDEPSQPSLFDAVPVECRPGWFYPSPPAEDALSLFGDPSSPLDLDTNLSTFSENAPSIAQSSITPSRTCPSSPIYIQNKSTAQNTVVSFSTTFYPGNPEILLAPNMVLSSEDETLFYLNSHLLASTGFNVFSLPSLETFSPPTTGEGMQGNLLEGGVSKLPDDSATLNIIFHILYGLSCAAQEPSLEDLSKALSRMPHYNLSPPSLIQSRTPLYMYLMSAYAPFQPLQLYSLAAHHGLEPLAVAVSSHLLGYSLSEISDNEATTMGPIYLKRLFFMHKGRTERLKHVLVQPPVLHDTEVECCDADTRAGIRRKWALLVTRLAWDARPDISPHSIKEHLRPTGTAIQCSECRESWNERSVQVATDWATVKFTI